MKQLFLDLKQQILSTSLYKSDYVTENDEIPFRISKDAFPFDLRLTNKIGEALQEFYFSAKTYLQDAKANSTELWKLLSNGKPSWMIDTKLSGDHLFVRPDLIVTANGLSMVEMETSPFGLGLSTILEQLFVSQSLLTKELLPSGVISFLIDFCSNHNKDGIVFVVTDNTKQYLGQFQYIVQLLSNAGIESEATHIDNFHNISVKNRFVYRCFYLYETIKDKRLEELLTSDYNVIPNTSPIVEEKAILALLWEKSFESYISETALTFLRSITPKTWILSLNSNCEYLPEEITSWNELGSLNKGKRRFVLKSSGFTSISSWGKGVSFLHKMSGKKASQCIETALNSDNLFIIQEFWEGNKHTMKYYDFDLEEELPSTGKVRVTPYFSVQSGKCISAKATLCEKTDYIHGMVDAINVPLALTSKLNAKMLDS